MKNSIYKRSDGQFEGRIQLGRDENGTRKYVSLFGRTRKEVNEKISEYRKN